MGITNFIVNFYTTTAILLHIYLHHKLKKQNKHRSKHHYVFILMALILSIEHTFGFLISLIPFYSVLKFILVSVICFPFTNMSAKIYKEYVQRVLCLFEDNLDKKFENMGEGFREKMITGYDRFFVAFYRFKGTKMGSVKSIEFSEVERDKEECKEMIESRGTDEKEEVGDNDEE